jgi:biopolymer transport protein ExbB/TolQ
MKNTNLTLNIITLILVLTGVVMVIFFNPFNNKETTTNTNTTQSINNNFEVNYKANKQDISTSKKVDTIQKAKKEIEVKKTVEKPKKSFKEKMEINKFNARTSLKSNLKKLKNLF